MKAIAQSTIIRAAEKDVSALPELLNFAPFAVSVNP